MLISTLVVSVSEHFQAYCLITVDITSTPRCTKDLKVAWILSIWNFTANNSATRKSSWVNARGIPPATYQVLHLLSYPKGGAPSLDRGTPFLAGGYIIPGQVTPCLDLAGVPPSGPSWRTPVLTKLGYPRV